MVRSLPIRWTEPEELFLEIKSTIRQAETSSFATMFLPLRQASTTRSSLRLSQLSRRGFSNAKLRAKHRLTATYHCRCRTSQIPLDVTSRIRDELFRRK